MIKFDANKPGFVTLVTFSAINFDDKEKNLYVCVCVCAYAVH